jgi:hypothetical protein
MPAFSDANGWGDPKYYSTIEFGDIDGDGKADICGRGSDEVHCFLSNGSGFPTEVVGPAWSDANGWGDPKYYQTFWTLGAAPPMATPPGGTGGGSGSSGSGSGAAMGSGAATGSGGASQSSGAEYNGNPQGSDGETPGLTGGCAVTAPFGSGEDASSALGLLVALGLTRVRSARRKRPLRQDA